jgi:hypothetical protein
MSLKKQCPQRWFIIGLTMAYLICHVGSLSEILGKWKASETKVLVAKVLIGH